MGYKKDDLFQEYIKLLKNAGIYDPKLTPQIRQAAATEALINSLMEDQSKKPPSFFKNNTRGVPELVISPLLTTIAKYQSVLINQLRAIGLNYDATPTKMTDLPNAAGASGGGLGAILAQEHTRAFVSKKPKDDEV